MVIAGLVYGPYVRWLEHADKQRYLFSTGMFFWLLASLVLHEILFDSETEISVGRSIALMAALYGGLRVAKLARFDKSGRDGVGDS